MRTIFLDRPAEYGLPEDAPVLDEDIRLFFTTYITWLQERFGLQDWKITFSTQYAIYGDSRYMAVCSADSAYKMAHITFRADMKQTLFWRQVAVHELLHIVHSRVDDFVEKTVIPQAPKKHRPHITKGYGLVLEPFTTDMTAILFSMVDPLFFSLHTEFSVEDDGEVPDDEDVEEDTQDTDTGDTSDVDNENES